MSKGLFSDFEGKPHETYANLATFVFFRSVFRACFNVVKVKGSRKTTKGRLTMFFVLFPPHSAEQLGVGFFLYKFPPGEFMARSLPETAPRTPSGREHPDELMACWLPETAPRTPCGREHPDELMACWRAGFPKSPREHPDELMAR